MPADAPWRLRAPLQGLTGALELLADAQSEAERRRYLALARECADELAAMLDDAPAARPLRLLVADDTQLNRLVVGSMLERAGHRFDCVEDGAAALAAAAKGGYDAVLLDLLMPRLDGYATAAAIRKLPGAAGQVPLVALSGEADAAARQRARATGFVAHLAKPVEREALLACLANLAAPTGTSGVLDAAVLARLQADVGAAAFLPLIGDYATDITRRLNAIAAADWQAAPERLLREAQDLRATAAMVGAEALAAAAAAFEAGLHDHTPDLVERRARVIETAAPTIAALQALAT